MKKIFIIMFTASLIICGIATFASGDREFSYNENRYLQKLPEISVKAVKNGDFQKELTVYTQDHFPARDMLMKLSTGIKTAWGIRDIGGAYLGRNNMYFEKVLDKDIKEDRYINNLKRINSIGERGIETDVMLIPSASVIYSEYLPSWAVTYDYKSMVKKAEKTLTHCHLTDTYNILEKRKDEYIYYRTDHHWTLAGAACVYESYRDREMPYKTQVFSEEFLGTLYSKTLDVRAVNHPDTVSIPSGYDNIKITADGITKPLLDMSARNEKDKYKVFLGGNYGKVTIKGEGKGTLLVFKDSFANSMVPFMTDDYEEIILVDMRYFSGDAAELADKADKVLILYEMTNFAKDSSISKI